MKKSEIIYRRMDSGNVSLAIPNFPKIFHGKIRPSELVFFSTKLKERDYEQKAINLLKQGDGMFKPLFPSEIEGKARKIYNNHHILLLTYNIFKAYEDKKTRIPLHQ
jgi:hypothetical protein